MITLEDCLEKLDEINWDPPVDNAGCAYGINNAWDRRFVSEVAYHTRDNGRALSTGQVGVINTMVQRYQVHLELAGMNYLDIEGVLAHRHCRLPPIPTSTVKREVRWCGDANLVFRFKFNPEIKDALKAFKTSDCFGTHKTRYESKHHLWIVPLSVANYSSVIRLISQYGFDFDDDVAQIIASVSNSRLAKSEAVIEDEFIKVESKDDALMAMAMTIQELAWNSNV